MTPLSAAHVARITNGKVISGRPDVLVRDLSIDSRSVLPGDMFVAFEGATVDGHRFVAQALEKGASGAIVTRPLEQDVPVDTKPIVLVEDALVAVQQLAIHERQSFQGPVIGVTGSNGKTTTKDMISTVFSTGGPCLATRGNLNTELGLPLTLLGRAGTEWSMVLEMGMRGLGQIAELCRIAQPTAGIITNIGHSHLELLGSQERIADAKGELLESLPKDGIAALTFGDPWLERIQSRTSARVLWYGLSNAADAYASDLESTEQGTRFIANVLGQSVPVNLPARGQHNVINAMGALLLGSVHGLSLKQMAEALHNLAPSVGRLRVISGHSERVIIDDCYNASPLSMRASLGVLMEQAQGATTVAVLGDMFELGSYERQGHQEVGEFCAEIGIGEVIAVGERAVWIAEAAKSAGHTRVQYFASKTELLRHLEQVIPTHSTVLVKASRGMAMEDIVSSLAKA
ncbi:UDP-N-acetylmuramoyl-tripeptide--D-alanyl-D-alanine ligase [Alicyclobacillus curvatus]|nr:UDP-N-acetylmuramoyl-tripeptide--D-alanyl-D-alanine ligase [Alicyclobacillus curvatus]